VIRSIGASRALRVVAAALCTGGLACNSDSTSPRPVPNDSVAVSYCAAVAPTWVAFRDGDGAWTRETPSVTGSTTTFRHSFTSNRAAIASLTPVLGGEFLVLRVLYAAPDELSTDGDTTSSDCLTGAFKSLRGTVAGIATTEAAFISIGPLARTGVVPREGLDFTIDGVATGPQDLLAVRTIARLTDPALLGHGPADPARLDEAEDFLFRVRSIVHLERNRNQNTLTHELQEKAGLLLGYAGDQPQQRVERLMGDYFRHARIVSRSLEWARKTAPRPVSSRI